MLPAKRTPPTGGTVPLDNPLSWPHPRRRPAAPGSVPGRATGRVLVGGIGYTNLRDRSFGPLLIERLHRRAWPDDVVIDDLSFGPIDVLFKVQAEPWPFRLGIFVGAVERGRPPGSVVRSVWPGVTVPPEEIQDRIAEGVTGIVSLDNVLHILQHFGVLPERTVAIEVEPEADESWGAELSRPVQAALDEVEALILAELSERGSDGPAPRPVWDDMDRDARRSTDVGLG